jgi:hypothetical protein
METINVLLYRQDMSADLIRDSFNALRSTCDYDSVVYHIIQVTPEQGSRLKKDGYVFPILTIADSDTVYMGSKGIEEFISLRNGAMAPQRSRGATAATGKRPARQKRAIDHLLDVDINEEIRKKTDASRDDRKDDDILVIDNKQAPKTGMQKRMNRLAEMDLSTLDASEQPDAQLANPDPGTEEDNIADQIMDPMPDQFGTQ